MFSAQASEKYNKFERLLLCYTTIVAPLICSLWSLEAAHANASDVFVFWIAAAAALYDLFVVQKESETGIPHLLTVKVIAIYNSRYEEFFQNQFYFVGFLLDPHMLSQVFKITSILICRYFGTLTRL